MYIIVKFLYGYAVTVLTCDLRSLLWCYLGNEVPLKIAYWIFLKAELMEGILHYSSGNVGHIIRKAK